VLTRFHIGLTRFHRQFIYEGDASTHAQGTDLRVALGFYTMRCIGLIAGDSNEGGLEYADTLRAAVALLSSLGAAE